MKMWIRTVAALMLSALLLTAFVSCNKTPVPDETEPSDSPEQDENNTAVTTPILKAEDAVILSDNKTTEYCVVYASDASSTITDAVSNFRNAFKTKTGATLQKTTDKTPEVSKEILISLMDGRSDPARQWEELTAPGGTGYRIKVKGEKIIVAVKEDYITEAMDLLLTAVCDCGNGLWGIPKEYVGELDVPAYPQQTGKSYYVGEGNWLYTVSGSTKSYYNTYLQKLEADGFSLYDSNAIGKSLFATYVKNDIYGNMMVYCSFHENTGDFRMTYGPMEYLPNVTPVAAESAVTPTITQMCLQMVDNNLAYDSSTGTITANNGAPGMSYLLQLSDGRFIIIDGGQSDGTIVTAKQDTSGNWVIGETVTTEDAKRLYDTMVAMKPAGHSVPTIALWVITHTHGDHMSLAIKFLETYKTKVALELVGFNFPAFGESNVNLSEYSNILANSFRSTVKKNFPDAQEWIMHTGQQMYLPGCEIEVYITQEDYACTGKTLTDDNELSLTLRITLGNTTFLVMGDTYPTNGDFMAKAYGDAMESDILQLAHHGFNGGVLDMYKYVDPKICFWACDQYRFEKDSRNTGAANGYYFNAWLRNNPWTRDGSSGTRQHYTASYQTTINALTGSKM